MIAIKRSRKTTRRKDEENFAVGILSLSAKAKMKQVKS
jgi:hypothetical protein